MSYLKLEDYVPVGEMLYSNLSRDLSHFTPQYKNMDDKYLGDFRGLLDGVKQLESSFVTTERQKKITTELYDECDVLLNKLMFMKSYAKKANLNYSIVTAVMKLLRLKNVEAAVKSGRDALNYFATNRSTLDAGNMPEGFLNELTNDINKVEMMNNVQNNFFIQKKELTAKNKHVYNELYSIMSEICEAGKMIFKNNDLKRSEYTLTNLKST